MLIKNNDIDFLLYLAEITGKEILIFYKHTNINIKKTIEYDSPIISVDKFANSIINDSLIQKYPKIPIISEKCNSNYEYNKRKLFNLYWLINPLDSTKEFVKEFQNLQ